MKSIKDLIRGSTSQCIVIYISQFIDYEVGLEFDPISDLIYWSLIAPLMNNL